MDDASPDNTPPRITGLYKPAFEYNQLKAETDKTTGIQMKTVVSAIKFPISPFGLRHTRTAEDITKLQNDYDFLGCIPEPTLKLLKGSVLVRSMAYELAQLHIRIKAYKWTVSEGSTWFDENTLSFRKDTSGWLGIVVWRIPAKGKTFNRHQPGKDALKLKVPPLSDERLVELNVFLHDTCSTEAAQNTGSELALQEYLLDRDAERPKIKRFNLQKQKRTHDPHVSSLLNVNQKTKRQERLAKAFGAYLQNEAMSTITSADGVGDVDGMEGDDDGEYLVPEEKTKKAGKGKRKTERSVKKAKLDTYHAK